MRKAILAAATLTAPAMSPVSANAQNVLGGAIVGGATGAAMGGAVGGGRGAAVGAAVGSSRVLAQPLGPLALPLLRLSKVK